MLLRDRRIDDALIRKLLGWCQSGFSPHNAVRIGSDDSEGRRALAEYIPRSPFSQEKLPYQAQTGTIIHRSKTHPSPSWYFTRKPTWLQEFVLASSPRFSGALRALDLNNLMHSITEQLNRPNDSTDSIESAADPRWHALWTRSHFEQMVHDQLASKGFELFLPMIDVWSRRGGIRHRSTVPMFPGYLFLHHAMDKASYIEVRKARGLVKVLGERWDSLAAVPNNEIESIQKVHSARVPARAYPYLREGERVRITGGLLAGVEGILLRNKPNRGLVVISIHLLQQSVAVETDCTMVEAA